MSWFRQKKMFFLFRHLIFLSAYFIFTDVSIIDPSIIEEKGEAAYVFGYARGFYFGKDSTA